MPETLAGERAYGVETASCSYLTVVQSTRRAVAAGETLTFRLWHFELSADEPAEAHAAVRIDGMNAFDERVAIPRAGGLISRSMKTPRGLPMGSAIYFHLHNHGMNSWALVEVSAGP